MAGPPTPLRILETLGGFQRTAALRAALELDLFTAIGEGAHAVASLARRCSASERGVQALCDYLTMLGFLEKKSDAYSLSADAAAFLDARSPAYLGASAAESHAGEMLTGAFAKLTEAVRRGGTALPAGGVLALEHPMWVQFARTMAVPGRFLARRLADCVGERAAPPEKILDIAAGHGLYGIELAKRNARAEVFAVDWPAVLAVARGHAEAAGVLDRFHPIPGDALAVDYGAGYDLALVTNFMPDLDSSTHLLKRVHSALLEGGRLVVYESTLDDDRVSPPAAVSLNLILLATTPAGEVRTASQLREIIDAAGFRRAEFHELPGAPGRVVIAYR
ncbi:MAG: methyltransferase [Myxococcota bacterium]